MRCNCIARRKLKLAALMATYSNHFQLQLVVWFNRHENNCRGNLLKITQRFWGLVEIFMMSSIPWQGQNLYWLSYPHLRCGMFCTFSCLDSMNVGIMSLNRFSTLKSMYRWWTKWNFGHQFESTYKPWNVDFRLIFNLYYRSLKRLTTSLQTRFEVNRTVWSE